MKIEYKDGLLFTKMMIQFNNQIKLIDKIVIDTGSSHTLISQDEVDDIGIRVTLDDDIITSYGIGGKEHAFTKTVQSIEVGDHAFKNVQLEFTLFKYHDINGLLGLDLLMSGKFSINLDELELIRLN